MRLRINEEGGGIHPNEVVVSIPTRDGEERLVVHKRSLKNSSLEVGYPIGEDNQYYLVELPRETMSGLWRIWVETSRLFSSTRRAA